VTRPWQVLANVPTPEGALELRQRGDAEFLIVIGGRVLMTSQARRSEEALAALACKPLSGRPAPRVLVGGLGMGYTLRAALDVLPAGAKVVVAELTPEVVDWCRGPLAVLTDGAVRDPRVRVEVADVARVIANAAPGSYDAIVLDLYEGPHAATQRGDDPFYGAAALARSHAALAPGGVLAIWSEEPDAPFQRRLTAAGFQTTTHRSGKGGRAHIVYLGVRQPGQTTKRPTKSTR
jgi:spermidine synthase